MNTVHERLNQSRQDLLDLSLRNTLLNYRKLKSKGVEVIDELPEQIYRILVTEKRGMSFLPLPEKEEGNDGEDALPEELAAAYLQAQEGTNGDGVATRHKDTKLQTAHTATRLQRRLLNTYYEARRAIEEQGINVLFLALGMLEWYQDPSAEDPRRAPLLLVPVELSRANVRSRFKVSYTEEDLGTNLSLQMKLRLDFGVTLPPLPEEAEELDLPT